MKNQLLGLVMVVFLLVVGTNDSFAQRTAVETEGRKVTLEQRMDKKEARHQSQVVTWQKRLELTDDQVGSLETHLSEYITSMRGIKENPNLSEEEKKMETKQLRMDYNAKFKALLTKEQQARYDSIKGKKGHLKTKKARKGQSK